MTTTTTTTTTTKSKTNRTEGSIANAFSSLSSNTTALPARFADLKTSIIGPNANALLNSWDRLLTHLKTTTVPTVLANGPSTVPEVSFSSIKFNNGHLPASAKAAMKHAGAIIVRGLVPAEQALQWKEDVRGYIAANPQTKGYPKDDIQVYEIYWSKAQLAARSHENMLMVQRALNRVWHGRESDVVDLEEPVSYVDRLRIRTPGDKSFNLGPHLDGGSIERWEDEEYRKCYSEILEGRWEDHDAFNVSPRLNATTDLYDGPGGCSAFRSYQGWISLSKCSPTNGTLRIIPDIKASIAYVLLRPFINPATVSSPVTLNTTSAFPSSVPGAGQELPSSTHPHIQQAFTSIPTVYPGDAIFWHCDTAHMVESEHLGNEDASVFYIPVAPLCDVNARYLKRQREAFEMGIAPPDFPGGVGESEHVGRGASEDLSAEGERAMGLTAFELSVADRSDGAKKAAERVNAILTGRIQ